MNKFKVLEHISSLVKCDKFIITGSLALELHGFKVEKNDIDIVLINPDETSIEVLKRLEEKSPTPYNHKYPGSEPISFIFEEVYVDIFIGDTKTEATELKYQDYYVAKVDRIVNAKISHNRDKDWVSLMRLARQILPERAFVQFIDHTT